MGIQAGDVVRLTHLLRKDNEVKEIYGFAKREMSPVLLHAAAFDDAITNVALVKPYASYRSIVMNRYYNPHFVHSTVPGSIGAYDLPDLAASIAPGKLLMVNVTDGAGENTDSEIVAEDISVIQTAYQKRDADAQLRIVGERSIEQLHDIYKWWINYAQNE